ncbi:MAG TPA: ABC transporter ATP-binding protein [Chitinophagaceae bacterium]|nr:ABC transporter ATP-binding protein [Chitinophagaceae bacterium]
MQPVIRANHLTKHFNHVTAVDDLSFTVNEGEVYGFLGQNGAGKSTTIRMLLTLVQPTKGSIEIFGHNLYAHRNEILRQIGAIIEKPDLYKYLSAYDNLSVFARLSGLRASNKLLMEKLAMVGLAERAHSKVRTFSQGMKQRLGIAVALVHDPRLIILDEPTNGLDPQGIADIRKLIVHLSRDLGKTIFVSSHLLNEIEQVSDRLLILDKGRKVVEGSIHQLVDPSNASMELKTSNDDACYNILKHAPEWSPFLGPRDNGHVMMKLPAEQVPLLVSFLVKEGIGIYSLRQQNSLEAYFLSVISGKAT